MVSQKQPFRESTAQLENNPVGRELVLETTTDFQTGQNSGKFAPASSKVSPVGHLEGLAEPSAPPPNPSNPLNLHLAQPEGLEPIRNPLQQTC